MQTGKWLIHVKNWNLHFNVVSWDTNCLWIPFLDPGSIVKYLSPLSARSSYFLISKPNKLHCPQQMICLMFSVTLKGDSQNFLSQVRFRRSQSKDAHLLRYTPFTCGLFLRPSLHLTCKGLIRKLIRNILRHRRPHLTQKKKELYFEQRKSQREGKLFCWSSLWPYDLSQYSFSMLIYHY